MNSEYPPVEIIQDSQVPGGFEVGMKRKVSGLEEEVTRVVKNRLFEYKIVDGLQTSFFKGRVLFKPEEDKRTKTIWTIWWTPEGIFPSLFYGVMIQGYCNLALYRLEAKISGNLSLEQPEVKELVDSTAENSIEIKESRPFTEISKLQWAARLQTGYEGNLTSDQEKCLNELREDLQKNDPETWELCQKHPDGPDRIMLRFLRAECTGTKRKFNIEKSKKRLKATLLFRQEWKADEMLENPPKTFPEFLTYGGELEIIDKEGRVVIFARAGILSTSLETKALTEDEWKMNIVCTSERRMQKLRENSKKLGHEVSSTIMIYDLKGFGLASRKMIPFTKFMNDVASIHYVEMVDMIILLNAPAVFATLYSVVKTFLDPITASKVSIYGSSAREHDSFYRKLTTFMDPKTIQKEFGGEADVAVPYPAHYKGPF